MSDTTEPLTDLLRGLAPSTGALTRERLLYEAGRSRGLTSLWLWRSTTALFAGMAVVLAGWLIWRPAETVVVVQPMPVADEPTPEPKPEPVPSEPAEPIERRFTDARPNLDDQRVREALRVRRDVLRFGVDQLPMPSPATSDRPRSSEELRQWLGLPGGGLTPGVYTFPGGF